MRQHFLDHSARAPDDKFVDVRHRRMVGQNGGGQLCGHMTPRQHTQQVGITRVKPCTGLDSDGFQSVTPQEAR